MGFVNKNTGTFNAHEYNWPEGVFVFSTPPAFHVETDEDIKRKKYGKQSETAISRSPYWTPEQKAGNQSSLRMGNVPAPIKTPSFKPVKVVRYDNLKLCESNWLKYLNSIQLGMFDSTNPYIQDLTNQSKIPDDQIRIMYDAMVSNYNKKPFDPEDQLYVDANGQVTTRKNENINESKSNPSIPTWEQYYNALSNLTSFYEDKLSLNRTSGIAQKSTNSTKADLSNVDQLLQQLKLLKNNNTTKVNQLTRNLEITKESLTQELNKRYNVSSNSSIDKGSSVNFAVSSGDFLTIGDFQNAANRYAAIQNKISQAAERSKKSSKTKADGTGNPLLNYSSDIVVVNVGQADNSESVALRQRDIERMHCNERYEDTVATIKLIKQSTSIIVTEFDSGTRLEYGKATQLALADTQDLFETSNFIIQATSEADSEKVQIVDNFGDPQIFMFGRRPRVYSYSGYLWNNKSNNWKSEFRELYERYLRGTKCVENGIKCLLTVGRSIRSGYIISCGMNHVADMDMATTFNFSMFIDGEKELLDQTMFNGSSTMENAFKLIQQQQAATQAERNALKNAIEEKLKIIPEQATTAPEPTATATAAATTATTQPVKAANPYVPPKESLLSAESLRREGQVKSDTDISDTYERKEKKNNEMSEWLKGQSVIGGVGIPTFRKP